MKTQFSDQNVPFPAGLGLDGEKRARFVGLFSMKPSDLHVLCTPFSIWDGTSSCTINPQKRGCEQYPLLERTPSPDKLTPQPGSISSDPETEQHQNQTHPSHYDIPNVLQFQTSVISVENFTCSIVKQYNRSFFQIHDNEGIVCGIIQGHFPEFSKANQTLRREFLLLSSPRYNRWSFDKFNIQEKAKARITKYGEKDWGTFYIMLVQWEGIYAERLGIGWIYCKAWAKALPEIKEIRLA
jgi:hypothetical protein